MQIIIKLTTDCNLRCVYCSEGDKPSIILPQEILYKLIDELPQLLDKYHDEHISILWHGGEPLVVGKKYLAEAMEYAKDKLKNYHLSFALQSNGTLIDDDWLALFKSYDVGVGISLDGYQALHDANRFTKDKQPTFERIIANIQRMQQAGQNVGTLMVLNTDADIDVEELFATIKKYELTTKIHPVIPCGRADGEDVSEVNRKYVELLKQLYVKMMETEDIVIIEPLNELMDVILKQAPVKECSYNGSCGKNFLCLYADGTVGFCGRYNSSEGDFSYGSLREQSLVELYESCNAVSLRSRQQYLQEHDCKDCAIWEYCHGGCSFEAFNRFGTIMSRFPDCEMRRQLVEFLQADGLKLLKNKFLRQKRVYRMLIEEKERLLDELRNAQE